MRLYQILIIVNYQLNFIKKLRTNIFHINLNFFFFCDNIKLYLLQSRTFISLYPLFPQPPNKYIRCPTKEKDALSLPSGLQVLGSTGYQ